MRGRGYQDRFNQQTGRSESVQTQYDLLYRYISPKKNYKVIIYYTSLLYRYCGTVRLA
jgi:hypothetical protein